MSNINNIKVGSTNPDSILFNKYKVELANKELSFGSIIPRDNSLEAINNVSNSIWQVNDGWEVEIINSKKLAIKKFKIDTWGIRQMIPNPHTNYNKLRVRVTGLTRVHQNVVCHTAGSTTADGFTKAYGGTAGYDVYWYPGHYTSGNSIQGMVIQFGCGYTANDNERYDSLQIGKHPWDVGTKVGISDGIIEGIWGDTDYKAITIGLYGGVQNAKSWHDETGDAYKQYDISDNPIYIDLNVDDVTKDIDVTSVECWDSYIGSTKSYHKDKTIDNCWKKYGLAIPFGWDLYKDTINVYEQQSGDYDIEWKTPFRICINKVSNLKIRTKLININNNYYTLHFKAFKLKVSNKNNNIKIYFARRFENITTNEDITKTLVNGINEIESFNKTVNRKDNTKSIYISEFNLIINSTGEFNPVIIDIIPVFEDSDRISINTNIWNSVLPNMFIPEVTDYLSNMQKITWNNSFSNTALANSVKNWYKNNANNSNFKAGSLFRNSKKLTDITILLPNENWLYGENNFSDSDIETITIKQGGNKSHITSPQRLFRAVSKLKSVNIIWSDNDSTSNYLCGANSVTDWMGAAESLITYPERLINWNQNRSHILNETIQCTLFQYAFNWAQRLVTIPSYPSDVEEDNTIVPARAIEYAFSNCKKLRTVGPILNMILVNPKTATGLFNNCNVLSSIRIKNLNHGDWNLDDVERDTTYHGTLKALDADSVKYLFANLADLTTHNNAVHEDTIDKSFKNWSSTYFNSAETTANWDYTLTNIRQFTCRKRYATKEAASFISATTAALNAMAVEVQGLQDGDSVIFGENGSVEPIVTWTTNGNKSITKAANTNMGFKLISSNTDSRSDVTITIYNGLDYTNPNVSSANLYCPKEWDKFVAFDFTTMINEYLVSQESNKVTFSSRKNTSRSDTICWIEQSFNLSITIKVEGLIEGDTLGVGQGSYNSIKYKITTNGSHKIEFNAGYRWGFKLWNNSNTDDKSIVSVSVDNTPAKVTSDMISAANAKGWKVFINGVEKK